MRLRYEPASVTTSPRPLVSRGEERYDAAGHVLGVDCVFGAHDEVEALPDPGVHQAQAPNWVVQGLGFRV